MKWNCHANFEEEDFCDKKGILIKVMGTDISDGSGLCRRRLRI